MGVQLIEEIVCEVLRRISERTAFDSDEKSRVLVFLCDDFEDGSLKFYLEELKVRKYSLSVYRQSSDNVNGTYEQYFDHTEQITVDTSRSGLKKIVVGYDAIIVAGISIDSLVSLSRLQIENDELVLLYEAMRLNKEVCIFSSDISVECAASGLKVKVDELVGEIETMGVKFPAYKNQGDAILKKDVINKKDVIDLDTKVLSISRNAVITSSARNLLKERDIEVIRK